MERASEVSMAKRSGVSGVSGATEWPVKNTIVFDYRVFHAITPITKQHYSAARYENQILKKGL